MDDNELEKTCDLERREAWLEHKQKLLSIKIQAALAAIPLALMVAAFVLETASKVTGLFAWEPSTWMVNIFTGVCVAITTQVSIDAVKISRRERQPKPIEKN